MDTLIDSLKILPFLFIAFLIIELIEHKLNNNSKKAIERAGRIGPIVGSALGIIPQCGFSVLATNLYVTRIITFGTLIAIYLSTSDEMLPILITQKVSFTIILEILFIKFLIGMISGMILDYFLHKFRKNKKKKRINYDICTDENCHCDENNFLVAALIHTLKTIFFIFIVTFVLNVIMEYLGNEYLEKIFMKDNFLSPFITSLIGLIPNCSASVILTELYINGALSLASTIAGLLTGSGVAILILFKSNRNLKENLLILLSVYGIGVMSGIVIELIEMFF